MATDKTVLDFPELTDSEDTDVIYVLRGIDGVRDKKSTKATFLEEIPKALQENTTVNILTTDNLVAAQAKIDAIPKNLNGYNVIFEFASGSHTTYTTTTIGDGLNINGFYSGNVYIRSADEGSTVAQLNFTSYAGFNIKNCTATVTISPWIKLVQVDNSGAEGQYVFINMSVCHAVSFEGNIDIGAVVYDSGIYPIYCNKINILNFPGCNVSANGGGSADYIINISYCNISELPVPVEGGIFDYQILINRSELRISQTLTVCDLGDIHPSSYFYTLLDVIDTYIGVTGNKTLTQKSKYLIKGDYDVTLPPSPNEGDAVIIKADGNVKIIQSDPEHIIMYKGAFRTTKGASGYVSLSKKEKIELRYVGSDLIVDEPGTKLSDPSIMPTGNGWFTTFSPDGVYLVVGHGTSPYITIYKRSGDTFTKLPNPSTLPAGTVIGLSFSPDGVYLACASAYSPYITIYKRSGDTFTKLPNPSTLPTAQGYVTAFSTNGVYLAVGYDNSPYIIIYKRSGDTFTKLSDPSTIPAGTVEGLSFTPDDVYLAVGHSHAPDITIYKRSGDTFTKLPDPSTLPAGNLNKIAFSSDGIYLVCGSNYGTKTIVYKRYGDTFIKLPEMIPATGSGAYSPTFTKDGVYCAIGTYNSTNRVILYKRSGDFFVATAPFSAMPVGAVRGLAFSPDGTYLAAVSYDSPYLVIYKTKVTVNKIWEIENFISNGLSTDEFALEHKFV